MDGKYFASPHFCNRMVTIQVVVSNNIQYSKRCCTKKSCSGFLYHSKTSLGITAYAQQSPIMSSVNAKFFHQVAMNFKISYLEELSTDWLTGWLTDWPTDSLTDWLNKWLSNLLSNDGCLPYFFPNMSLFANHNCYNACIIVLPKLTFALLLCVPFLSPQLQGWRLAVWFKCETWWLDCRQKCFPCYIFFAWMLQKWSMTYLLMLGHLFWQVSLPYFFVLAIDCCMVEVRFMLFYWLMMLITIWIQSILAKEKNFPLINSWGHVLRQNNNN